ncbi:hypothetical protein UlMin_025067 [Ulmus minor]
MQDCKPVSAPLPVNFKLSSSMCLSNEGERNCQSTDPLTYVIHLKKKKKKKRRQWNSNLCLAAIFLLFFSFKLPLFSISAIHALSNETDRLALLHFKQSITSDPFGILSSYWNDSVSFCNSPGITCGRRHPRVTSLDLQGHNLKGSISPHIGNLTFLRYINLQNNSFSGEIPQQLGYLFRLQHLYLTNNTFGGRIPVRLMNCSKLRTIELYGNKLNGDIPKEIGTLVKLETFRVSKNNLTGGIPTSLGNLSSLKVFSVAYNYLSGNISDEIRGLSSLKYFYVGVNRLSSTIPSSLYNISSLNVLSIAVNQFNGNLPANIRFPNLQRLEVGGNEFSGTIPDSLSNASRLHLLQLSYNNFVGQVPTNFGNLLELRSLNLDANNLGGNSSHDWGFLTSLANCSKLESLSLSKNNFGGVLPNSIGNLTSQLTELILGSNYIHGSIAPSFGNLISLNILAIEINLLTGVIPDYLGKFENLQRLTLGGNRISGKIPSSIGNLTRLFFLDLPENKLEGSIPPSIGKIKSLQYLSLSRNNLSGEIPVQIFSLPSLSLVLNFSQNFLIGRLPMEVGKLRNLNALDLSSNNLSGEIPQTIGDCSSLEYLHLQGNSFDQNIPSSLASLKGLVNLDLSLNNFSGQVPKDLQELRFLQYLNISFNYLVGEVPTKGVFQNASAVFAIGNSKLCGGILDLRLPPCPIKQTKKKKKPVLKITICLVLGLLLFSLLFFLYWRKKSERKTSSTLSRIELLPKVSYKVLSEATSGFSPEKLIGSGSFGSVYKGILDGEEKIVAVKVLNLQKKGAIKSFMAECKALRNIRHRNLVRVLTSCSSVDYKGNEFKALVFEFMENGNLEKLLHKENEDENQPRRLSLLQRLDIVIDVASALHYLHDECEQPVIHCDLKPSNVLLDKDMIAHVSDFGIARLLSTTKSFSGEQSSTVGIMGTIGYTAPEYGMGGEASTQGDVYSFGILILEIFTARRPTDQLFKDVYTLHNFVKTATPERLVEIVDPYLLSQEIEETTLRGINRNIVESQHEISESDNLSHMNAKTRNCLLSVLEIGLACSRESPRERATMNDVTMELYHTKSAFLSNQRPISRYFCILDFIL